MAPPARLPGPRPAWYRRLPPALQRVAEQSDRHPVLPLRPHPALLDAVAALPAALAAASAERVEAEAQRIADGICVAFGVTRLRVRVASRRPHNSGGELHGLYVPGERGTRDVITLWMLTAKRGQVVAYKTFLRTLLHELCHHLDYTYLRLRDSLHTQGFYQRESSLYAALDVAGPASAPRPDPVTPGAEAVPPGCGPARVGRASTPATR